MLNKQWWTAERKSKLGVLTQTKLLCKSSLGSLVRKKPSHLRETTQRTEVWQKGKRRDCYIFFFSVLTCFAKSALNIKVSIYTGAVYTQQQGRKKVERTKGSKSRNFWTPATPKFFVWEMMWRCRYCVAVAAIIQYLQPSFPPCRKYTRTKKLQPTVRHPQICRFPCDAMSIFPLLSGRRRCFSSSCTQDECSHCEQHRHTDRRPQLNFLWILIWWSFCYKLLV